MSKVGAAEEVSRLADHLTNNFYGGCQVLKRLRHEASIPRIDRQPEHRTKWWSVRSGSRLTRSSADP